MPRKCPSLILLADNVLLKNFPLDRDSCTIGRSDDCGFVLTGREVSRRHARITVRGGTAVIEDLNSANGTFVNHLRISRQLLKHGDVIQIADFKITFNDGRGLVGIVDETQVDTPGEETQNLDQLFDKLKRKMRESKTVNEAELDKYHEETGRSRKKYKSLSNRDRLTNVFNRGYLDRILPEFWHAAQTGREPLSLLFIDLDHFKKVNDTYGHDRGDEVLKTIAQLIRMFCRRNDIIARYGGEEFVVIYPSMSADSALEAAESLRKMIEQKSLELVGFRQTVSIGVATYPADARDSAELLQRADQAVYQAKKQGRNRVVRSL
jgi:diguanylate cyclase (GGDEF)-like protein